MPKEKAKPGIATPAGKIYMNAARDFDKAIADRRVSDGALPPDCDEDNERRSQSAQAALHTFVLATGTEAHDVICDVLCNLMHFADRYGFTFKEELKRAQSHYWSETQETT